jgi:hypothetical protein
VINSLVSPGATSRGGVFTSQVVSFANTTKHGKTANTGNYRLQRGLLYCYLQLRIRLVPFGIVVADHSLNVIIIIGSSR